MKPATWNRVRELFERLEDVPFDSRRAWIGRECSDEPEVRAELERLALADVRRADWVSTQGHAGWLSGAASVPLQPGARVGPYRVCSLLGAGGMGTVYCAEQDQPRRLVALKTLREGVASQDLVRRFRTEAEVLAHLRHPGIAQIHDAGTHEDGESRVPYLAMEYVEGARDLVEFAAEKDLDRRARLEMFIEVCAAVHHGHQKGVIHRDLKPANVLVDAEGRPKVIDFGLARPLDADGFEFSVVETRAGEILGTLAYMSPEHVSGRTFDVDVRSDVFSLGCVLCELVSGAPPRELGGIGLPAAVRRIEEQEISLAGRVSGELRWILEKALAGDPARRYDSAAALADDVRRMLDSQPVEAGPPSTFYRLSRLARRHRALLAAAVAVLAALSIGLYRARGEARNARRAGLESEQQAQVARTVSDFLTDLFARASQYRNGRGARVVDALELAEQRLPGVADPTVRAALTGIVGKGYLEMDDLARAEGLLEQAVADLRQRVPPEDPFRLRTEVSFADVLEQVERIEESRALSEELLPRLERVLGPADELSMYLRYNLAVCCGRVDEWSRAEQLYRVNLEHTADADGGPGLSADYLNLLHRVGTAQGELGRFDEAIATLEEALRLTGTAPGVSPLYAPTIRMDLAGVLTQAADDARALELLLEVERDYRRLGPSPSNRVALAVNLGWSFLHNDRADEAGAQLDAARRLVESTWGTTGPRYVECLRLEAGIALQEGELGFAEEVARDALELARADASASPAATVHLGEFLARVLLAEGFANEACEVAAEAHATAVAVLGEAHPQTRDVLVTLARALFAAGRGDRARALAAGLLESSHPHDPRHAQLLALVEELAGD